MLIIKNTTYRMALNMQDGVGFVEQADMVSCVAVILASTIFEASLTVSVIALSMQSVRQTEVGGLSKLC